MSNSLLQGMVLVLLTLPLGAAGKAPPTKILVSDKYITLLVFDAPINGIDIGSHDYAAKIQGRYLILRCRKHHASPTSLFVTYDEERAFLHAEVHFSQHPPKPYDLRREVPPKEQAAGDASPSPAVYLPGIRYLAALPQAYYHLGIRKEGMTLILTNVLHDAQHIYLKLFVENQTGVDYQLEAVHFSFHSGRRKQVGVFPAYVAPQGCIAAYSWERLLYALPRYGPKLRGRLAIQFREAGGERHVQFTVPARVLLQAAQYTTGPLQDVNKTD